MQEAFNAYEKARKKGGILGFSFQGKDDGLLALGDIVDGLSIGSEISLGYREVDIDRIVGTKNKSRAYGFSRDFMPVLPTGSEFANKWRSLYTSVMEDGIKEPVKIYEYLHKYYVEEGNKRVSVAKFMGYPLMPANVIRIIPKYDESDERIVIYYEFLEFYSKLAVDFIEFSARGMYKEFYKKVIEMDLPKGEEVKELRYLYNEFKKVYLASGGAKLKITIGDAFFKYMSIYDDFGAKLEKNIRQMWAEFTLACETPVEVDKEVQASVGFISQVTGIGYKNELKVAFVHAENPKDSNWVYYHEEGMNYLKEMFEDRLVVDSYYDIKPDDEVDVRLSEIADKGYDVIFTCSATLMSASIKVALKYKNTKFLNASEHLSSMSVRTYYNKMYEANFLLGVIAGGMSFTGSVGVCVSYPIPEVIRSVNAFTMGGKFINKDFNVFIKWLSKENPSYEDIISIDEQFALLDCDIVWHNIACGMKLDEKAVGLYLLNNKQDVGSRVRLAKTHWDWRYIYERLLASIYDGTYYSVGSAMGYSDKASVSYVWGLNMGACSIEVDEKYVPDELRRTKKILERLIKTGALNVFEGAIYDKDGNKLIDDGEVLSREKIREMDFFVEGIKGSIPSIKLLEDNGSGGDDLVEILSVKKEY